MDFIYIEKQFNILKAESSKHKKNITPLPSQLNSPLNISKIHKPWNNDEP